MFATPSAARPLHLVRPLLVVSLALALALGAFLAQSLLSMATAAPPAGGPGAYVAGPPSTPSPTPVATPAATPDPGVAVATPAPTPAHSKVIRVSIHDQRLTAYEDGQPVLTTVVATGRPELPTPIGTFDIAAKYTPYTFVSPWPKGDPYWYPTVTVSWAMLFHDGGYFLHDSPHRTQYGPGTNLINGTHGCVNVPSDAMARLYAWAEVGTVVIVQ